MLDQLNLSPEEEAILLGMRGLDATELALLLKTCYGDNIIYRWPVLDITTTNALIGALELWSIPSMGLAFVARKHFTQGLPLFDVISQLERYREATSVCRREAHQDRGGEA